MNFGARANKEISVLSKTQYFSRNSFLASVKS